MAPAPRRGLATIGIPDDRLRRAADRDTSPATGRWRGRQGDRVRGGLEHKASRSGRSGRQWPGVIPGTGRRGSRCRPETGRVPRAQSSGVVDHRTRPSRRRPARSGLRDGRGGPGPTAWLGHTRMRARSASYSSDHSKGVQANTLKPQVHLRPMILPLSSRIDSFKRFVRKDFANNWL